MNKIQAILVILTSILSVIFVYHYHYFLINYSMFQFRNVSFVLVGFESIGSPLTLHLAVLSIPIFYFIIKRISNIRGIVQTLLFLGVTILSGIFFWWLRLTYLKAITQKYELHQKINNSIALNKLHLEAYCWFGFLCGAIVCMLIFKLINKRDVRKRVNDSSRELLDN